MTTSIIEEHRRPAGSMSRIPTLRRLYDLPIPSECRELVDRGALVAVSTSGGKDSQAMMILLSTVVPREQLLAVHAPLGEVELPETLAQIESTIPGWSTTRSGPHGIRQVPARTHRGKGTIPSPSARFCTSDTKRGPIERELGRFLRSHPRFRGVVISAMGLRRDESAARARRLPWSRSERNSPGRPAMVRLAAHLRPHDRRGLPCHPGRRPGPPSRLRHGNVEAVLCVLHHGFARRSSHRRASCNRRSISVTSISKSASAIHCPRPASRCRS